MEIVVSQEHGHVPITVFQINGRINLGNAEQLQSRGQEAFEDGARNLILDLGGVESITSAGLRAILAIHKLLASVEAQAPQAESAKSDRLKLVNPAPQVQKVLSTAGFTTFIEIYDDLSAAIASF